MLKFEMTDDSHGHYHQSIKSVKGGNLTLADIHNALVNQYGGGCWVLILNCNDDTCVDKISEIEFAEADESYFA